MSQFRSFFAWLRYIRFSMHLVQHLHYKVTRYRTLQYSTMVLLVAELGEEQSKFGLDSCENWLGHLKSVDR